MQETLKDELPRQPDVGGQENTMLTTTLFFQRLHNLGRQRYRG
jgi:hypothetical protein